MNSRKANSREYQRQAIDAEIKSLEESIRALKRRRNAVAPISSLPTEIIATIFSTLRLFTAPIVNGKSDYLAWLHVTHVCHHWREIALNNPIFWSHIDFNKIPLAVAAEMLVRAKMAPLNLEAWATNHYQDNAWFIGFTKVLQSHVTNLCHLKITPGTVFLRRALKGLSSPAPTLESLSLTDDFATPSRTTISQTLFGGIAPRLFSLELHRCNISWKSPLLKGLRYLQIHAPSRHVRPSLADWLDALDQMPQLKNLVLYYASPIAPPIPLDVKRTVTLPFLTDLDIAASAGECSLALSHFVLPVLTQLRIEAKSVLGGRDVLKLLPYVARHSHGPQDTKPLQNVVIYGERKRIEISAYSDTNFQLYDPSFLVAAAFTAPRVTLFIKCQFPTEVLDAAMTALPLDNLLQLTAPSCTRLDELFWRTHAPRWPLLQCVRLAPFAARGFREMILQDNCGHENPLLPSLTNLILHECILAIPRTLRLRDALMKRMDQGVPLETLDLRSCYATNSIDYSVVVQLLSEIVVDVLGWAQETLHSCPFFDFDDNDSGAEDYLDNESSPRTSDDDEADEGGDDKEIDDDDDDGEEDYGGTTDED